MAVRLIAPSDLEAWCRMRRALWPDAAPRELIREAEAYFDGTSSLQAVLFWRGAFGRVFGDAGAVAAIGRGGLPQHAGALCGGLVRRARGTPPRRRARSHGRGRAWACERGHVEIASDALIDNLVSERAHLALGFIEVERAIHFRKQVGGADNAAVQGRELT